MNQHIELTQTKSFASWEGGSFNDETRVGHSTCIAGPNAEKLPVLYDKSPSKSRNHFLFVLDVGCFFAEARVVTDRQDEVKSRLSLSKVKSLYTENVQGHAVCRADTESVWAYQANHPSLEAMLALPEYTEDQMGYKPELKAFMQAALTKAATARDSQTLFWGVPRKAPTPA